MSDDDVRPVRLADYRPPAHLVDRVELHFRLAPEATRVRSRIRFRPNPEVAPGQPLMLDGEGLRPIHLQINGRPIAPEWIGERGVTVPAEALPEGPFLWESEVEIAPATNSALEGLYISRGMYCTQCEAEGFRRITYYPDRPDVMAPFRVRIESDLPVMLSNGNPVAQGPGWAEWEDPWPKPSYLFALVAGELVARSGRFVTRSGREVALNIWVRPGDEERTGFALEALGRAMRWDKERYGREYDLDVFNIVAVDDFNMGAMENKGLNIFNARCVLASPDTATDADHDSIERIIAHEYFHNWTGNRITCRDWFQLSLKEGLTVFRDQQYMEEVRSGPVKRIEDVMLLRRRQFREDAGPLAHPVQPAEYVEINNFYTATVYEKGAELVRMLRTLLGEETFSRALDLYFERHDGQACTIEDWLRVFEDASGRDLATFRRWYAQAGTPRVQVREHFEEGRLTLTLRQHTPPTPGQPEKAPVPIPVAIGLLGPNGDEQLPTTVLLLEEAEQSFTFDGLAERPVVSWLRGFSAPVILEREAEDEELAFLMTHDGDAFARWEAGRELAMRGLLALLAGEAPGTPFLAALEALVGEEGLDPAFRAMALRLPSEGEIAETLRERGHVVDPDAIHTARTRMLDAIAGRLEPLLASLFETMAVPGPYRPAPADAARRALRLAALRLLARRDGGARAEALFATADNMTESLAALATLLSIGRGEGEIRRFRERWEGDRLVMDKWFAVQIAEAAPEQAVAVARRLAADPAFTWRNPNRFRAVMGALAGNHAGFHAATGEGYDFLAEWLIRLDPVNPQTAARMASAFESWRSLEPARRARARSALERIAAHPELSRDLGEMVTRLLAPAVSDGRS